MGEHVVMERLAADDRPEHDHGVASGPVEREPRRRGQLEGAGDANDGDVLLAGAPFGERAERRGEQAVGHRRVPARAHDRDAERGGVGLPSTSRGKGGAHAAQKHGGGSKIDPFEERGYYMGSAFVPSEALPAAPLRS